MTGAVIMLIGLGIDALIGWPNALYAAIRHPVVWIGQVIGWLDSWLNLTETDAAQRRIAGLVAALAVIALSAELAAILVWALPKGWGGWIAAGALAWPFIAFRSLSDHVRAVARPLVAGDLPRARGAVAMIVGRDPNQLDEHGVARAALESLAENASDGVVAPIFWGAIFGLPGIVGYKAINTLDSMIGHRTPRHEAFGWAAAKIDDVANLIPARLTGLLFAAVSGNARHAVAIMRRDAGLHRSPNAGWPEAAMAAGLGVRLSGPRVYHDRVADEPWVNGEAPDPAAGDIDRGLALYRRAVALLAVILVPLAATVLWGA
ncbi:adenosylcobinamide-phosphate synthase [Defluviimonas denitrificans]|jgi:adenosylcobinamide-phosphate synthase|uniref:Cobalamin biosynthesis protein CobD n=1 Tax=Albidovulum denitrificans TaxID=404881 RepID=A0A2S8S4M4_9RHOB|nr:adenosylcobinamide-phosphate synthase CbiB [Defluviimonas denitrificans]PQV55759.1 adenosylcobinamide-phosphate synthase [Defluviimonas denitrificans]